MKSKNQRSNLTECRDLPTLRIKDSMIIFQNESNKIHLSFLKNKYRYQTCIKPREIVRFYSTQLDILSFYYSAHLRIFGRFCQEISTNKIILESYICLILRNFISQLVKMPPDGNNRLSTGYQIYLMLSSQRGFC